MKKIFTSLYLKILLLFLLPLMAQAQHAGNSNVLDASMVSQYYFNQYLANPAMAGIDTGLNVHVSYRKQWVEMKDGPVTRVLTADYQVEKKMGVGLTVYNDMAGIINRTRVGVSYAYHVPLNEQKNEQLHLGMSLVMDNKYIQRSKVIGQQDDPSIDAFNRRDNYFEADFGMAYTNNRFTLQAALPNLVSTFRNNDDDGRNLAVGYVAASYKFGTNSEQISSWEPKIALRGVRGYKSIVDVGVNVQLAKNFANLFAMYHSSNSVTAGIGFHFKNTVEVQASYTSQTAGIKTNVDGNFGLSMKIRLFK